MLDQRDDRLDLLARILGAGHGHVIDRTALWAIHGEHATVPRVPIAQRAAVAAQVSAAGYQLTGDGIAVIDVAGPLSKWASIWRLFGLSDQPTLGELADAVAAAENDPKVSGVMLRIDSPGGTAWGTPELADAVFAARQTKPVHAYAVDQAASGAYWVGSQASRFTSNQLADVGSIGAFMLLVDSSKYAEGLGLRFIRVRSGERKGIGAPGVAVTEADEKELQRNVDALHQIFLAAIERGRPGLAGDKLAKLADGRLFIGEEAAQLGLTDGVEPFDVAMDNLRAAVRANNGASSAKGIAMADQNTTPAPAGAGNDHQELEELRAQLEAERNARAKAEQDAEEIRTAAAVDQDLTSLVGKVPPAVLNKPATRSLLLERKRAGDEDGYKATLDLLASCDASGLTGGTVASSEQAGDKVSSVPTGLEPSDVTALKELGMTDEEIAKYSSRLH